MTYISEHLFIFLTILLASIFILLILLPKIMSRKAEIQTDTKIDTRVNSLMPMDAFAKEIRSLKGQLAIQERLATLGEVSAGIAHELRNPMTVIAGNTRLLLRELRDEEQKGLAEGILKEIEEINTIIEELLKFATGSKINKKRIDISQLIREVVFSVSEGNKVSFEQDNPVYIYGDEQLLKQALRNIIKNAAEAGTMVWITLEKAEAGDKESLSIAVRDNGRGLAEDELNKVFMPFYSTKDSGIGMGLPLVQKIVVEHGGSVRAESKEGEGSVFTMTIPVR